MDLFKAHDCLPHDLLTAELEAHGISKSGLNLSYYQANYQIEKSAQWSTLGPLFFNLFINDLSVFLERTNVCNFADDNTIYKCDIADDNTIYKCDIADDNTIYKCDIADDNTIYKCDIDLEIKTWKLRFGRLAI